jgi:[acyl-carrier-protein] S-malonyltransferase
MSTVFLFPGQSSRYPEMFDRLAERAPVETREVLGVASEIVRRDLARQFQSTNTEMFAENQDVQLGVFLANHIHLLVAEREGIRAERSVGLSLGELNHLVHIGALDFPEALRLVRHRGAAYDHGPPGAMVSVFPLPLEQLEAIVEVVRPLGLGVIEIANLNSPMQHVLSGDAPALAAAAELLGREGVECVVIERNIAMHSSLFRGVADALAPTFAGAAFKAPSLPYLPNVLGQFEDDPSPQRIARHLTSHVWSPVLFRQSIELLLAEDPDAAFVEVGPRSVLFNLLSRKWMNNRRFKTDTPDGPPRELAAHQPRAEAVRP